MSKADFTAQQAAIAPAVAELDKPEIKVGQVWRMRNGEITGPLYATRNSIYPFGDTKMTATWTENGVRDLEGGHLANTDLIELVKDENGFTIWRGGEQPAETIGKRVEYRYEDDAGECEPADHLRWAHTGSSRDIHAYKVVEAAAEAPAAIGIDPGAEGGDRHVVSVEIPPGYDKLFDVLMQAFKQAANGKGKERHARAGVAFEDQPMSQINKQLGSIDGFIYQAHKKSLEAKRLPDGRAQAELLGSINYLCGAVIALDTWAKKDSAED